MSNSTMHSVQVKQVTTFIAFVLLSLLAALGPGRHLATFAYQTPDQSYILLIPVLTAMLLYRNQDEIFAEPKSEWSGIAIIALVIGFCSIGLAYALPDGSEIQMAVTA